MSYVMINFPVVKFCKYDGVRDYLCMRIPTGPKHYVYSTFMMATVVSIAAVHGLAPCPELLPHKRGHFV